LKSVLADDQSDIAQDAKLGCFAAIPDAKMKEQVWKEFTDPKSKLSEKEKEAQMAHFYNFDQKDMLKPYHKMYFSNMLEMYKNNSYKFFKSYFGALLPRENEIDVKDIEKLEDIKK